jgi:HAD superfamily phosphoserine phosphatase-like hydrolase
MKKFAVFDVDWTIHSSALGIDFIHQLINDGVLQADFDAEAVYRQWQKHEDGHAELFMNHYRPLFHDLIGQPRNVLLRTAKTVADKAAANLYPEIAKIIEHHKNNGYFLLFISNSPTIVLTELMQLLDFNDHSGGEFIFDKQGNLQELKSTSNRLKSDELNQLVKKHSLSWEDSYGYGDSADDISMLELVTNPVAVSPRQELLERAQNEGWQVLEV